MSGAAHHLHCYPNHSRICNARVLQQLCLKLSRRNLIALDFDQFLQKAHRSVISVQITFAIIPSCGPQYRTAPYPQLRYLLSLTTRLG